MSRLLLLRLDQTFHYIVTKRSLVLSWSCDELRYSLVNYITSTTTANMTKKLSPKNTSRFLRLEAEMCTSIVGRISCGTCKPNIFGNISGPISLSNVFRASFAFPKMQWYKSSVSAGTIGFHRSLVQLRCSALFGTSKQVTKSTASGMTNAIFHTSTVTCLLHIEPDMHLWRPAFAQVSKTTAISTHE